MKYIAIMRMSGSDHLDKTINSADEIDCVLNHTFSMVMQPDIGLFLHYWRLNQLHEIILLLFAQ